MSTQDQQVEGQCFDRKSLRIISRDHGDFPEFARACVCFANSAGGQLVIGVARMLEIRLVERSGRTKATRYSVPSKLLRFAGVDIRTTLARVLPHRLRALILEDLERFPESSAPEIHQRVGREIPPRSFRRSLEELVAAGQVLATGERRWRRYRVAASIGQEKDRGR